jgi:hypothetical protein
LGRVHTSSSTPKVAGGSRASASHCTLGNWLPTELGKTPTMAVLAQGTNEEPGMGMRSESSLCWPLCSCDLLHCSHDPYFMNFFFYKPSAQKG